MTTWGKTSEQLRSDDNTAPEIRDWFAVSGYTISSEFCHVFPVTSGYGSVSTRLTLSGHKRCACLGSPKRRPIPGMENLGWECLVATFSMSAAANEHKGTSTFVPRSVSRIHLLKLSGGLIQISLSPSSILCSGESSLDLRLSLILVHQTPSHPRYRNGFHTKRTLYRLFIHRFRDVCHSLLLAS